MLLTLFLGDKQARRTRWEVDTMVYGIPSHLFVTKQQSCFINFQHTFQLVRRVLY